MFNRENIDERTQKALFKKIKALDRKNLSSDKNFLASALDSSKENPFSESLVKACFAKVSVAVPQLKEGDDSTIIRKPISISSYLNEEFKDSEKSNSIQNQQLTKSTNKDIPLAFQQGYQESTDNRFRGHSGITKISVAQQEYYTYKFTIDWVCPDPVYFEDTFEPSFLKLGAYCAIEFGWGIDDSEFQVEPLSIEEMRRLLDGTNLLERNLKTSGNYYCGVGTVTKFDWKIESNGVYTGNIEVLTPGASALLETTQNNTNTKNVVPVTNIGNTLEVERITKELLDSGEIKDEEERQEILNDLKSAQKISEQLQQNTATFNVVMNNLEKVIDKYSFPYIDRLGSDDFTDLASGITYKNGGYSEFLGTFKGGGSKNKTPYLIGDDNDFRGKIQFYYNPKGTARLSTVNPNDVKPLNQVYRFASWGWFEDEILNNFFSMSSGETIIQQVGSYTTKSTPGIQGRSREQRIPNYCKTSKYLYSLGLDSVILPGEQIAHPILFDGFNYTKFENKEELKSQAQKVYTKENRYQLSRVYNIYQLINETFGKDNSFITKTEDIKFQKGPKGEEITQNSKGQYYYIPKDEPDTAVIVPLNPVDVGIIRNMVFPVDMFKKHFSNTPSLRQGLRNFWTDVSNQYGRYWQFQIGEDVNTTGRVGIFDSNFVPKGISVLNEKSTEESPNKMFNFSIYSKNSIVKSFDVNLNLSAEAATLARYGAFTKAGTERTRIDGKKDIGLEAWNILNSQKEEREIRYKEQLEDFRRTREKGVVTDLKYNREEFIKKISSIEGLTEDLEKAKELIMGERYEFVKGVGIYDAKGNMSSYFKQTMLYLLNYSTLKNSDSNIEVSQPIIPVSLSMTLEGIGGLKVGNIFTVDYLPKNYREYCYFMISKIGHSVSTAGWETQIEAVMIADLPAFWKISGYSLNAGLEDYQEIFEYDNISEENKITSQQFINESSPTKIQELGEKNNELVGEIAKEQDKYEKGGTLWRSKVTILYGGIIPNRGIIPNVENFIKNGKDILELYRILNNKDGYEGYQPTFVTQANKFLEYISQEKARFGDNTVIPLLEEKPY